MNEDVCVCVCVEVIEVCICVFKLPSTVDCLNDNSKVDNNRAEQTCCLSWSCVCVCVCVLCVF